MSTRTRTDQDESTCDADEASRSEGERGRTSRRVKEEESSLQMKGGLRWPSFCTRDRRSDRRSSSFRPTGDDLMADKRETQTPCFKSKVSSA